MTGSVALDVVIGLVFIYSLYSLLTTTVTEIIATATRQRPKFLVKGINRMLNDDSGTEVFSHKFYKQPLIKYLASDSTRKPAYMAARNFSKNLIEVLKEEDRVPIVKKKENILVAITAMVEKFTDSGTRKKILEILNDARAELAETQDSSGYFDVIGHIRKELTGEENGLSADETTSLTDYLEAEFKSLQQLDLMLTSKSVANKIRDVLNNSESNISRSETVKFLRSLLDDAQNDMEKFKAHLEKWYDDTMERVSGWYKKRIQWITFVIGFVIAGIFNVDTIAIVNKLSHDPKAREQFVSMAEKLSEDPEIRRIVYGESDSTKLRDDFLNLRQQALEANNVLAIERKQLVCNNIMEAIVLPFLGWFITAIALSLGAPFWFDLLNKLVKLRGSVQVKKAEETKPSPSGQVVAVEEREG